MRILIIWSILTWSAKVVYGQNTEVVVRVIDATTKKPIRNASVVVDGTTKGTATNFLGYGKVTTSSGENKLIVSHVTYETQLINIPPNTNSFTIPLPRGVHELPNIDLTQYPNDFNPHELKRQSENQNTLPDSFQIVESYADFPYSGGVQYGFQNFFGNAFRFPAAELRANKSGTIAFEFTINESGEYSSPKCLTDSLDQICNELKRILTVIPKWKPAKQYGEPVSQTFLLSVYYAPNKYWKKKIRK